MLLKYALNGSIVQGKRSIALYWHISDEFSVSDLICSLLEFSSATPLTHVFPAQFLELPDGHTNKRKYMRKLNSDKNFE
jgi:hypothetical protein